MKNCIVLNFFDHVFSAIGIKKPVYNQKDLPKDIPSEHLGTVAFGLIVHLSPIILFIILLSLFKWSLLGISSAFVITSFYSLLLIGLAEKRYPCVSLDPLSKYDFFKGMSLIFVTAVGAGTAFVIVGYWALSKLVSITWPYQIWTSVVIALLLTDFTYYWIHRALGHSKSKNFVSKWYRKNHAPHHAVKALDFYRGNLSTFLDTAITGFQLPLIFIATILGMSLETVLITYYLLLILQSTHHANHTFHIGIVRYILVDNHSHKLHHCPYGFDVNFGAVFSIWDIFFRTYYEEWNLSASYMASGPTHEKRIAFT